MKEHDLARVAVLLRIALNLVDMRQPCVSPIKLPPGSESRCQDVRAAKQENGIQSVRLLTISGVSTREFTKTYHPAHAGRLRVLSMRSRILWREKHPLDVILVDCCA